MTQAKSKAIEGSTEINVFGKKPSRGIFFPGMPFSVRNDCQIGQWKVGDKDFRGESIEISIIKVSNYFGSLSKSKNTNWLQIWFVPAPSCLTLPASTVCVTYIKTRSIAQFSQKTIELMSDGEPGRGVFIASFREHSGELGTYYSVMWDWRERKGTAEVLQLKDLAEFLASEPQLYDPNKGELISIDNLAQDEIEMLITAAKSENE